MYFVIFIFVFILGLVVGSFLNVVIYRYGKESLTGRSKCLSCGNKLAWWELLPVISFMALRGKCSSCRSEISIQYPLVELATGLAFVVLYLFYSLSIPNLLVSWVIWSSLIVIFVYDLKHKIIPDSAVFVFWFFSLVNTVYVNPSLSYISNHLLAGIILSFFIFILWFISKGRWIGFGDVKLAMGMGFYLGIKNGIWALAWSFWSGAIVGLLILIFQKILEITLSKKRKFLTIKSAIPFGPFMIIGIILSLILKFNLF